MDRRILQRGALLVVLILAFATRISGLTAQSLWRDEVDALRFAYLPVTTLVSNFVRPGWNGPLFYVLLRAWVAVAGRSELALRYFSLCFGLLGVALTYRLGRAWFSPFIGGLAALLMACSPYMVWYGQEAKMYALLCTLVLVALFLYRRALQGGDWRAWVAVLVLTYVTVAVHIMGALVVPVMVALFCVWWPVSRAQWRQALLVLAAIVLPGAVALPWVFPVLIGGADIGHRFVNLLGMVNMMLHAFSRGITSTYREWPMGLALFALLAGVALWPDASFLSWMLFPQHGDHRRSSAGVKRERANVLALVSWMAVPVVGLYAISLRVPMFLDRYLIWIGPAFYLLVARGLDQIRRRSRLVFICCLVAMLGLNGGGVIQQSTTSIKSDFRTAAAYVRQHRQPDELILFHISYVRFTFEYYHGDSGPSADGVATDQQTTESAVDAQLRQRTAGYDVVWLVLSEPEMWDRRGMTEAWLEKHAAAEMRADLTRVSVVKYRISSNLP